MKLVILDRCYYNFERNEYALGGVTTYIRNLVTVAASLGLEPHILFDSGCVESRVVDGVQLHSVLANGGDFAGSMVAQAARMFDPETDILLFSTSTFIRKSPFRRTIGIQHGIYWDMETMHGKAVAGRASSLLLRALQARQLLSLHALVSKMVCVDLNYVNWMRALSVANRLPYVYIPNFADVSARPPARFENEKVRIVFARRFELVRGCDLLMSVMPRLLAEHPQVELTLAGSGSMEQQMRAVFGGNPNVSFTRYDASQSVDFHAQFDIALVPSVGSEGTSLSLLEAMAAGCAVLATDVGGMSNIILDGHNGLLSQPTADNLYHALTRLIEDACLRRRLGDNARKSVADAFSKDAWIARWSELLKSFV